MNQGMRDEIDRGTFKRREQLYEFCRRVKEEHDLFTGDPAEVLIYMAATGRNPVDWRKPLDEQRPVLPEDQIDAAKAVMPFMRPKLTSVAIQEGASRFGVLESEVGKRLMANKEVRELYERMQIESAAMAAETEAVN